jgi:Rps23 Pro-64 3,4-dihydroxylase Tpa1-like proline 4-hydroxylase
MQAAHKVEFESNFQAADRLTSEALHAMSANEINAIRVKNFYSEELSKQIAQKMLGSRLFGAYENAPNIGRVGQALFESQVSDETQRRYWDNAHAWTQELRTACFPYLSPMDKLRLELDEAWQAGATLGSLDKKRMFVGLARVFNEGAVAEPHQDILAWDMPNSLDAHKLRAQFAGNIYLQMPPEGGELTLWPIELSKEKYGQIQNPGSYGLDATRLPQPIARLTPENGELILFNSRRVHAVEPPKGGPRITWSCFIGMSRDENPLIMWS